MKRFDADQTLYESVADRISGMIADGSFRPGDRLPSLRKIHLQLGVSISTALHAYTLLENRGRIEARPQSGYFVRVPGLELPPEPAESRPERSHSRVSVSGLHRELIEAARRKDIVQFGSAIPDPEILPHSALNRMLGRAARTLGGESNMYDFPPGCEKLRRAIAKRSLEFRCNLRADGIITTCGAMEAVQLAIRAVTRPGDIVAVESPTYFGILEIIESLDLRAVEIPTCPKTGMSLSKLEDALKRHPIRAVVAVTNFSNPLGVLMPDEEKKELVKLVTRYDVPLIEDDVYGDLSFDNTRPSVAKSYDKKDLVLLCSSFSKTLAPGYRVGWIAPGRYYDRVLELKLMSTVATPTLPQLAVAEFLTHGGFERHLRTMRKTFASQVLQTARAVKTFFPPETKVTRPQGGFVLWLELPEKVDSLKLFDRALNAGITISPGPLFTPKKEFLNCIRLNCGLRWSDRVDRALHKLGQLVYAMM